MTILRIIADVCIALGCFFALAGVVGLLRMPDAFCRMQSSTNITTLGILGAVIGCALHAIGMRNWAMLVKTLVIGLFFLATGPIAGHIICKGAYRAGVRPEREMVCDEYGRDEFDD